MLCLLLTAGCGEGVKLVQETESGGVVIYPFRGENGYLLSPLRAEALQLIEKRCAGRYSIVKEGEAKGRSRLAGPVEGAEEVIRERRWGLKFQCR